MWVYIPNLVFLFCFVSSGPTTSLWVCLFQLLLSSLTMFTRNCSKFSLFFWVITQNLAAISWTLVTSVRAYIELKIPSTSSAPIKFLPFVCVRLEFPIWEKHFDKYLHIIPLISLSLPLSDPSLTRHHTLPNTPQDALSAHRPICVSPEYIVENTCCLTIPCPQVGAPQKKT